MQQFIMFGRKSHETREVDLLNERRGWPVSDRDIAR